MLHGLVGPEDGLPNRNVVYIENTKTLLWLMAVRMSVFDLILVAS
jgi:hypothetical protein